MEYSEAVDRAGHLRLEKPHAAFADSYRGLVKEFVDAGEELVPFPLSFPNDDFAAFVARLEACSRGEDIPPGFVAHSTFWLVDNETVVAVSNLRHSLTDALRREGGNIGYGVRLSARRKGFATEILRRTLERARDLGLSEALVTCSNTNEASSRTIVKNGGVLDSEEFLPERDEVVQRYRVALTTPEMPESRPSPA